MGLHQAVSQRWEQVRTCLVGERGSTGMAKLSPACKLAPLLISAHISPQHAIKRRRLSMAVIAQLAACFLVQSAPLCAHQLHVLCNA